MVLEKSLRDFNKFIFLNSQCGLLSIDSHPLDAAKEVESILKDLGIDSQMIVGEEFKERFPMLNFPDDSGAVLEEAGGVLMANKCGQSLRVCYLFSFRYLRGVVIQLLLIHRAPPPLQRYH